MPDIDTQSDVRETRESKLRRTHKRVPLKHNERVVPTLYVWVPKQYESDYDMWSGAVVELAGANGRTIRPALHTMTSYLPNTAACDALNALLRAHDAGIAGGPAAAADASDALEV